LFGIIFISSAYAQYDSYTGFVVPTTAVLPAKEIHPTLWFSADKVSALYAKRTAGTYIASVWSRYQSDLSSIKSTTASSTDESDRPRMAKLEAFTWVMTGDTAARRKAIECLLIAYDNVPRTATSGDFDGTYDEIYRATWLQNYCEAYDWVQNQLTTAQDTTIRSKIIAEVLLLRNNMISGAKYSPRPHNHRSKPAWAIVTAALTFSSDSRAADWLTFGLTEANTVTKYMYSDDGIYREGSHYNVYNMVNMIPYLWHYKNVSGVDQFPYYQKAFEMLVRIRDGKGWIPNIEDGYVHPIPSQLVAAAYKNTSTPLHPTAPLSEILQWNWANTSFFTKDYTGATADVVWSIDEFITYDPTINPTMPQISATQRTTSGIVVFRDTDTYTASPTRYLLFHAVAECDNHNHPDQLSYILEYNNTILATDAGYGADGSSDAKRAWYTSNAAHNIVTVDTIGPQDLATNIPPKDLQFINSSFYGFAEKQAKTIATNGAIKRGIAFPNKKYWVVYDLGTASSLPVYRLNIHSRGTMSRTDNKISWLTTADTYGTAQKLHAYVLTSDAKTITDKAGWTSLWKDSVSQSYVEIAQTDTNVAFLHLLYPDVSTSSFPTVADLSSNGVLSFQLTTTDVDLFALQQANNTFSIGNLTTDAVFSWVSTNSGTLNKYAVTRGTSLIWNSRQSLYANFPITAAADLTNKDDNILVVDTLAQNTTIQFLPVRSADSITKVLCNGSAISFTRNNGKISVTINGTGKLEFISGSTGIHESHESLKKNFGIIGNYPNPFNPSTTIYCEINSNQPFYVRVYDIYGKIVKDLVHGNGMDGAVNIRWDGTDNNSMPVSSGIYFFELSNGMSLDRKKGILLK
jgi:hypothetical protein